MPEIISLTAEDWPRLRAIRLEAVAAEPQAFQTTVAEAEAVPDEHWQMRLSHPEQWHVFAEHEGELIGLAAAFVREPGQIWVVSVYVRPAHRGQGIATRMMRTLVAQIKNRPEQITLCVNLAQADAIQLYKNCGFEPRFECEDRMGDGQMHPVLHMEFVR